MQSLISSILVTNQDNGKCGSCVSPPVDYVCLLCSFASSTASIVNPLVRYV